MEFYLEQRKPTPIGVILIVIGIIFAVVAVFPFPLSSGTDRFLNETYVVPAFNYYWISYDFAGGTSLHMEYTISGGSLNFWVIDESEYNHFRNGETFDYYTSPSQRDVSTASFNWVTPNGKVYFIWDNSFGLTSKSVSVSASQSYVGFLPDWIRVTAFVIGSFLFIAGLAQLTARTRVPPSVPSAPPPLPIDVTEEKMFCRYCGAENKRDAIFCEKCAKKIG